MHHLINELRPHQARESIRVCLRMQKKQREEKEEEEEAPQQQQE